MSYTSTARLGSHHDQVIRGLAFYKEEIHILESRLLEVASKNSSFEARQGIEHFQNQFVLQRTNIDELRHKYNEHLHLVSQEAMLHGGHIDTEKLVREKELSEEYHTLERVIKELWKEFNAFLSKWM